MDGAQKREPEHELENELKRLRQEYLDNLPSRVIEIENLWHTLSHGHWSQANISDLHRHTHSLIGSGATFGFEAITRVARELDTKIKSLLHLKLAPSIDEQRKVRRMIAGLRRTCVETSIAEEEPNAFINTQKVDDFFNPDSPWILILDDASNQSGVIAEQIQAFGYQVRTISTKDTQSATSLQHDLSGTHFDSMVVMFSNDLSAVENSLKVIKQALPYRCPTIFVSDDSDITTRLSAVRAGSDAFINQPVDITSLIDQLDFHTRRNNRNPYRILIVDDCDTLAHAYSMFLQRAGMETLVVSNPLDTLQAIIEFNPELILTDMYMPECSGSELAKVIRQQNHYDSVPIVFLSAESDIDKQLDAMALGGDDFLTKPISAQHLITAVGIRAERYRELRSHMVRDSLTGLYNHTRTEEQLNIELCRAERENTALSYVMIDIDHFKQINDTHGHSVGDEVLKRLARLLQQSLRKTDTIGRYGGEEFAVILGKADTNTARQVIENIRQSFNRIVHQSSQGEFSVSFSAGIASFPHFSDPHSLNDAADKALYSAKKAGRNQIHSANHSKDAA